MLVLGLHPGIRHGSEHPTFFERGAVGAAAALYSGGSLVAAASVHDTVQLMGAVRRCLEAAGAEARDLHAVGVDGREAEIDALLRERALQDPQAPNLSARQWLATQWKQELHADLQTEAQFWDCTATQLRTAAFLSGCPRSLGVCLNGPEYPSVIGICDGERLETLRCIPAANSLAGLVSLGDDLLNHWGSMPLNARDLDDERASALYVDFFRRACALEEGGSFKMVSEAERLDLLVRFLKHHPSLGPDELQPLRGLVGASLRLTLLSVIEHVARHFKVLTNIPQLCLSGSIATHPTILGALCARSEGELPFASSVALSEAGAIGAALLCASKAESRPSRTHVRPSLYLGGEPSSQSLVTSLRRWSRWVHEDVTENIVERVAPMLCDGRRVAWIQGRAEVSRGSWGHRCVLTTLVNRTTAFAATSVDGVFVADEWMSRMFEWPHDAAALAWMPVRIRVHPDWIARLGNIVGADSMLAVRPISAATNPLLHALLQSVGRRTGLPLLLNVCASDLLRGSDESCDDLLGALVNGSLDGIAMGSRLVVKGGESSIGQLIADLCPVLVPDCRLTRGIGANGVHVHTIEHAVAKEIRVEPISAPIYEILARSGSCESLSLVRGRVGLRPWVDVNSEWLALWRKGLVSMRPVTG